MDNGEYRFGINGGIQAGHFFKISKTMSS